MEKLLIRLNDLYTELEYETDSKTIVKIEKEILEVENQLKGVNVSDVK